MNERRYREGEVRRIFELATEHALVAGSRRPVAEGLTLAEIQSIGAEVGVSADAVARAAAALDARSLPKRRSWGMPIEVGRIIPLPRALTDHEWDRLVAELRTTFRARGRVVQQGGLREWSNGNLHACVEPAGAGYRLRLGTVKGDAAGINALGATGLVAGAVTFGSLALSGGVQEAVYISSVLGASGAGAFIANLVRLPRWSRRREQQMEYIAARVQAMMDVDPKPIADS